MRKVVFVAPYLGANMLRCLLPLSRMEDVQLGVVSHQPEESFPSELRARLAGHYRVENSLDPAQLVAAGEAFQESWGGIDRWLGYLEQQQEALAAGVAPRCACTTKKRVARSSPRIAPGALAAAP